MTEFAGTRNIQIIKSQARAMGCNSRQDTSIGQVKPSALQYVVDEPVVDTHGLLSYYSLHCNMFTVTWRHLQPSFGNKFSRLAVTEEYTRVLVVFNTRLSSLIVTVLDGIDWCWPLLLSPVTIQPCGYILTG